MVSNLRGVFLTDFKESWTTMVTYSLFLSDHPLHTFNTASLDEGFC